MSQPADLSQSITDAAGTPQSASADGQSASARPIDQLIKADQYLALRAAAGLRRRGMRFSRLILPAQCSGAPPRPVSTPASWQ